MRYKENIYVYTCSECDSGIQPGEGYYNLFGDIYCERCMESHHWYAEEPEDPLGWCKEDYE